MRLCFKRRKTSFKKKDNDNCRALSLDNSDCKPSLKIPVLTGLSLRVSYVEGTVVVLFSFYPDLNINFNSSRRD